MNRLDDMADEWIAQRLGPDPDPRLWPRVDEGRHRRTRRYRDEEAYVQPPKVILPDRPPDGDLCASCGLEEVAVRRTRRWGYEWLDLCDRCYRHMRRTGRVPSSRANYLHARRLGRIHWLPDVEAA